MRIVFWLCTVVALASCNKYDGYSELDNGIYRKLHTVGATTDTIHSQDFVLLKVSYATLTDSVFYSRRVKFQVADTVESIIDYATLTLSVEDSASFIVPTERYFTQDFGVAPPSFLGEDFKLNIRVDQLQTLEAYNQEKERLMAWSEDFKVFEQVFLDQYIKEQSLEVDSLESGLYKISVVEGEGIAPEKGDTLDLQYAGKFLNGTFFDSSSEVKRHFQLVLGTEWQIVSGLELALKSMVEGEKSLFVMPSNLAFGSEGSSTGIVPPYTSVVFEVQLDRVAKGDSVLPQSVL